MAIAALVGSSLIMAVPSATAAPPADGARAASTWGQDALASRRAAQSWHTVTLVTGDRLRFRDSDGDGDGDGASVTRLASPGRDGVPLRTHRADGRLFAIPADAEPLLAAGRLDRRLFDLTGLVEARYTDADRDSTPLLITAKPGVAATAAAAAPGVLGVRAVSAGVAAAAAGRKDAVATWQALRVAPGVETVWLDGVRATSLDRSVPQIGAPAAYAAGLTGAGVTVAVLDSGVDQSHPDLAGRVAVARNFTEEPDGDFVGHGTHVASTVGGTGAASGGHHRGVAYEATLLDGKVCEGFGCMESAILAGMEWAAAEMGADVVNMSLGGADLPGDDPLEAAVDRLTAEHGTLFVIAAGNDGAPGSVGSPSTADAALSVGAVDRDDTLAPFSSRGPRNDGAVKPEITAPGVGIVAAAATGAAPDSYVAASGTSMATPHVAGAAALLAQQRPDLTAAQLKALLVGSAAEQPGATAYDEGAGRVDVAAALGHTVLAEPATVSFGRPAWPHADDEPVTRTVTLANTGAAAVTLALALDVTGPDGAAPPAGMFTLGATEVTIPAGGSVAVPMTADTGAGAPDGLWSGLLAATGDGVELAVPVGVDQEVESYDLDLRALDFDGAPIPTTVAVVGVTTPEFRFVPVDGAATVRLPRGEYLIETVIHRDGDFSRVASIVQPRLALTGPTAVTLDARAAQPVEVTTPDAGLERATLLIGLSLTRPDGGGAGTAIAVGAESTLYADHLGDANDGLVTAFATEWAEPDGSGWYDGSPRYTATTDLGPAGRWFDGLRKRYRDRDLARIDARHHGPADRTAIRGVVGFPDGYQGIGMSIGVAYPLPSSRVERLAGAAVTWLRYHDQGLVGVGGDHTQSGSGSVPAGRRLTEHWGRPVFGPTLAVTRPGDFFAARLGDEMLVGAPLYGDRDGHLGDLLSGETSLRLYRDGVEIGRSTYPSDLFVVPPEPGAYRVEIDATDHTNPLSDPVSLAWEFRSGHVGGETPAKLPVTAVRYTPALDDNGAARGNGPYLVPVSLQRQGLPVSDVRRVQVDVSYDDGATWRRAPLVGLGSREVRAAELDAEHLRGAHSVALLWHPRGPGFVSLRATTTDRHGNASEQTLIRAYALR